MKNKLELQSIQNKKQHNESMKVTNEYDEILYSDKLQELSNLKSIKQTDKHPEYKKYRKDIFKLVKSIMKNQCDDKNIVYSFHQFVNDAIVYLRFKKIEEITQNEYSDIESDIQNIISPTTKYNLDTIEEEYDETNTKHITMNKYGKNNLEENNKLLFKKHTPITKRIEDCIPIKIVQRETKHKTFSSENILHSIIPKQKKID
jgi:hypothetical protein